MFSIPLLLHFHQPAQNTHNRQSLVLRWQKVCASPQNETQTKLQWRNWLVNARKPPKAPLFVQQAV